MTSLDFLGADPAAPEWRSPLAPALGDPPEGIRDISGEARRSALGPEAGVAGLELEGQRAARALRRLTDADLERLPVLAPVARVRALVERPETDRFRVWFPQEYGDHVVAAVLDAWDAT